MKTSRVLLLGFIIFFANLAITLSLTYYLYQNFILPSAVRDLSDTFIDATESIGSKMPIGPKERKQYLPEMSLIFPYEKVSDQLIYSFTGDEQSSTEIAIINYANSSVKTKLKNAQSFEELFLAFEGTGDCRRLYVLSNTNKLEDSGLEASKYKKLDTLEVGDKKLHMFKLIKSCEADAGIGPATQKQIESILSQGKGY